MPRLATIFPTDWQRGSEVEATPSAPIGADGRRRCVRSFVGSLGFHRSRSFPIPTWGNLEILPTALDHCAARSPPAALHCHFRPLALRSLTPAPPPSSGTNSTPPFSRAPTILATVSARPPISGRRLVPICPDDRQSAVRLSRRPKKRGASGLGQQSERNFNVRGARRRTRTACLHSSLGYKKSPRKKGHSKAAQV